MTDQKPDPLHAFPSRLREAREAKGWSHQDLGNALGAHESFIRLHLEVSWCDQGYRLNVNDLVRLCTALSVSPNWLLGWNDDR